MVVAEPEAASNLHRPLRPHLPRELTDFGEKDGPERFVASEAAYDVLVEQLFDARSICVVKFRSNVIVTNSRISATASRGIAITRSPVLTENTAWLKLPFSRPSNE